MPGNLDNATPPPEKQKSAKNLRWTRKNAIGEENSSPVGLSFFPLSGLANGG
jgi:hypothetical protein